MAKHENVFNPITFDYIKHYTGIYFKLQKFLKDFNIEDYIHFKDATGLNNCLQCHIQISEPVTHEQAKKKLFNCFVNEKDYLVQSELKSNKELYVPGKGIKNYQFDVFVINVKKFLKFMNFIQKFIHDSITLDEGKKGLTMKLNLESLLELEQGMIFAVEADGDGHSDSKDAVRDRFFFRNYNIVTVRYKVHELVPMGETAKMKKTRLKYNIYQQYANTPLYHNITSEQIVSEAITLYRNRYIHIP